MPKSKVTVECFAPPSIPKIDDDVANYVRGRTISIEVDAAQADAIIERTYRQVTGIYKSRGRWPAAAAWSVEEYVTVVASLRHGGASMDLNLTHVPHLPVKLYLYVGGEPGVLYAPEDWKYLWRR